MEAPATKMLNAEIMPWEAMAPAVVRVTAPVGAAVVPGVLSSRATATRQRCSASLSSVQRLRYCTHESRGWEAGMGWG